MKKWLGYTLAGTFAATLLAGAGIVRHLELLRRAEIPCIGMSVTLNEGVSLLGPADVENHIAGNCGEFLGSPLASLDLAAMESRLRSHEMVRSCQVWATDDGTLHVKVEQMIPAIRFADKNGNGFYSSSDGTVFPLVDGWTADVPVVCGEISEAADSSYRMQAMRIVELTSRSKDWEGRIQEYLAIDGSHFGIRLNAGTLIDLGPIDRAADKLGAALDYCTRIEPYRKYEFVSVDFKGQIVCRKII